MKARTVRERAILRMRRRGEVPVPAPVTSDVIFDMWLHSMTGYQLFLLAKYGGFYHRWPPEWQADEKRRETLADVQAVED